MLVYSTGLHLFFFICLRTYTLLVVCDILYVNKYNKSRKLKLATSAPQKPMQLIGMFFSFACSEP